MNTERPNIGIFARLKLRWFLLLRSVLHWWVKAKVLPDPFEELQLDPEKTVCFVIDSYSLSTLLILDRCCEEQELPRPLWPMETAAGKEPRSYLALRRKKGLIVRRTTVRSHSKTLRRLVENVCEERVDDISLVPVTVLIGRAPDKETGLAKIFFSESWEIGGRFRRLLSSLINGRHTIVQFSKPISLRELADEDIGAARAVRKVARILRVHFQRVRAAAIGPDLSHRRTLLDDVLRSPPVRAAIEDTARRKKTDKYRAWKEARKYAYEIAANYSYGFVRVAYFALTWFWNRIYDGVELKHFGPFREMAPNYEIIYVPCHRSHIDYLLVSYFVYINGLVPPHIAAGVNLNLPVLGRFLRKGGAFFLRRSFRSQALYSAVFHEYLARILANGTAIEYFIEGTRSRTGRLLQPKGGMLSMTIRGYLRARTRPLLFQPIYVGYEKLVEGKSYIAELSGGSKKSESWGDLFKVYRVLKQRYGKVHVSFAEPVLLDEFLDRYEPGWRDKAFDSEDKPAWLTPLVNDLGQRIMTGMNQATHVNAINLLAVILLTTRKLAMGRSELAEQLELALDMLQDCDYSQRVTFTKKSPGEIIAYGEALGVIEIRPHPLGDIVAIVAEQSVLLTYYRNNISHLVALPSLVSSCFLHARRMEVDHLKRIALALYPFLKAELFLPWEKSDFLEAVDRHLNWLQKRGLLRKAPKDGVLMRPKTGSPEDWKLRITAHTLLQTFERYYITVAILAKNGSGTLTRSELERLCILTAQRITELNEFAAPEFYDRNLFRQFIGQLRENGVLTANEENKLEFNAVIRQISEDARYVLSKEIRHGIMRVAPQVLQEADNDESESAS
jgi:glycerol-3-phosphate O-acyltransferase